jgi:acyl-CoA thioesterase-1
MLNRAQLMKSFIGCLLLLIFLSEAAYTKEIKVIFVGDSLTAGYGVEKHDAFPALIEKMFKEKKQEVKVINGGVSGSTTANGQARMKWFFKSNPDIIVLSLGANDGLRGVKIEDSFKNLDQSIKMALKKKVKVLLMGMQMPPNYGADYRKKFKAMFPRLAKENKISIVPFMLEGVAGKKKYNISDGIHPNEEGHKIMAKMIFPYVEKIVQGAESK